MNKLNYYNNLAEDYFSNYGGESSFSGDFDFSGEFDYGSDFCGATDNVIEPYDRTLTFIIQRSGGVGATIDAVLFGAFENAAQDASITVSVAESSHAIIREETKSNPYHIRGQKVRVTDAIQFGNPFKVQRQFATGSFSQGIYQPENYISPTNFNDKIIDDPNFSLLVDGRTAIRVPMLDGITMTITFTVGSRGNVANLVKGKPSRQLALSPRATGNPLADRLIAIRKAAPAAGLEG